MYWPRFQTVFVAAFFVSSLLTPEVHGGICWLHRTKYAICTSTYQINMTKEECCQVQLSYNPFTYWTPENLQFRDLVRYHALYGGVPGCQSCRTSCVNVRCGASKTCRMRGGQPRCICSPDCTPPVRLRQYRGKLCGSDGQEYRNYCNLLKHNCRHRKSVTIAYFGECQNSCRNVNCYGLGQRCLEDRTTLPHCVYCNQQCGASSVRRYLCDEDGHTHHSFCHLIASACRFGRSLRLAYYGRCRANATCSNIVCPAGKTCLTDPRNGRPVCYACNRLCEYVPSVRVCGTDHCTYGNYCELSANACRQGIYIKAAYSGACRATSETSNRTIHASNQCRLSETITTTPPPHKTKR